MTTQPLSLTAQLEAAKNDLALYQRLIASEALVEELTARFEKERAEREAAETERKAAEQEARFRGFGKITVSDNTPSRSTAGEGVLWRQWLITVVRPTWNPYTRNSTPVPVSYHGFTQTPPEVMEYLIEKHPKAIPAAIMAIKPGDPQGAINELLWAKQRGYLRSKPSA